MGYDMHDAKRLSKKLLGCPIPEELKPIWGGECVNAVSHHDPCMAESPHTYFCLMDHKQLVDGNQRLVRIQLEREGVSLWRPLLSCLCWCLALHQIPEDLSPRSFRSMFGHNTNIWAAKAVAGGSKPLQQLEGHVGMIPLDAPPDTFYSEW